MRCRPVATARFRPALRDDQVSTPSSYSIRKCLHMLASNVHGQSARNTQYFPSSYIFSIRAPPAVASIAFCPEAVGTTWYVTLFLACGVDSRLLATCLATCPYRVWYTVTRAPPARLLDLYLQGLGALARTDASTMSLYLFSQSHRKSEKQNSTMDASECLCLAAFLRKHYSTYNLNTIERRRRDEQRSVSAGEFI